MKYLRLLSLFFLACISVQLSARFMMIKDPVRLSNQLSKQSLAVVMFYVAAKKTTDARYACLAQELERMFKDASAAQEYRAADVAFIALKLLCASDPVVREYTINHVPAFMIFQNGIPVDKEGRLAKHEGPMSYSQLRAFIDDNLADSMDEVMDQKQEERQMRAQEAAALWYPYLYYNCGWGGWGYPGFGCNWGAWNGCYYYRPGVYFNIGAGF